MDLGTLRVFELAEVKGGLADKGFLANQVVVEGEQVADGVQFVTRGMAKFALPDLEMTGVQRADVVHAVNNGTYRSSLKIFSLGLTYGW